MGTEPLMSQPTAAEQLPVAGLPGDPPSLMKRTFLAQWLILALALLTIGGTIANKINNERLSLESIAHDRLSLGARSSAAQVERRLASINIALIDLLKNLPYLRTQKNGETLIAMNLLAFQNAVDGVRTVGILDSRGTAFASSRAELVGKNFSQREFFQSILNKPDARTLYVSAPFSTISGNYSLNISRAIIAADGEFSGIITATLDPEDLKPILTSLRYTPDVSVGLIHGSGKTLIYISSPEIAPGTDVSAPASFFSRHLQGGNEHSLLSGFAPVLPNERLAAVHTINPPGLAMSAPLVVVVSQEIASVLGPWHVDVRSEGGLFALLASLACLTLYFYQRRERKLANVIFRQQQGKQHDTDRLQLATEASNTGVWELDLKSRALTWDDTMFRLYGRERADFSLTYASWLECLIADDRSVTEAALIHAIGSDHEFDTLFRIRRGDGETRIIDARAWAYFDAAGQPLRMIGVNRDITQRQQIEQSLRDSKDFIVSILHSLVQHIAVLNARGVIVTVNQAWQDFARANGASEHTQESVGLNYLDICRAATTFDPGQEVEAVLAGIGDVLAGRRQEFSHEYDCHSPDEERWFIMHVTPLRGSVPGAVVAHENITARRLAERAVRESEERFSAFFEYARVGMARTSPEKGWIQVNPALCSMLAYQEEELAGKTWAELTHPDDLAAEVAKFERLLRGESDHYSMEKRFIAKDGKVIHTDIAISAVRHSDRSIAFIAAIVEDISERKVAEEAARSALRLTQQFLDHLPGTAYVKDQNLRVLLANKAFQKQLGMDPAAIIGKTNSELFTSNFARKLDADDRQVLESGQSSVIEEDFEGRCFESSKFVIEGEAGQRLLGGITFEVTQRQKSFARQQVLLKISELGGTLTEKDLLTQGLEMAERLTGSQIGFLHFVNGDQKSIELATWTAGALKGCAAAHDDHYPLGEAGIWADCARDRKIAVFNDYPGYGAKKGLPDGHTTLRRLITVPVVEEGKVRMILGVGNKLTDYEEFDCASVQLIGNDLWRIVRRARVESALQQKLAELTLLSARLDETNNRLLQSEKLASIGQLAAGVAHEINNPVGYVSSNLNSLTGYVDQLLAIDAAYREVEERFAGSMPQAFAHVQQIKAKADYDFLLSDIHHLLGESREGLLRVRKIVKDLKDFSRVGETGWQRVDLHQGLESTLNIVWNEIKYRAEVDRDYADLPEIYCIPSQINQVFMNLMINAAQAIEAHGHIILRSGCDATTAWIEVQDDGAGVAPENLERIFDPFFTTKAVGKGTGLGLSLSWAIIQRHHGRIEVRPAPCRGSIFRVTLPLEAQAGSAPPVESET